MRKSLFYFVKSSRYLLIYLRVQKDHINKNPFCNSFRSLAGGHSQSHANSGSQNLFNHDKQGTSFVQPLPNGGQVSSFSTSQKGYSGASQGQSSLNNSNKKYENQQGTGQGSSSYLSPGSPLAGGQGSSIYLGPGSSHLNSGGLESYRHTVMTVPGLPGAANQGELFDNFR